MRPQAKRSSEHLQGARFCEVDEDLLALQPDGALIAGEVMCRAPEIVPGGKNGTYRLKYPCRHVSGETWTWDVWISLHGRNLIVEDVKD